MNAEYQQSINQRIAKTKRHVYKIAEAYEMQLPVGFNREGNTATANKEVA